MPVYSIRQEAAQDLDEIRLYIADRNPIAALELLQRFQATFRRLAESPLIGRARAELGSNLRSFPVGNYIIFYRPTDDGVDISRVLHGSRDIETLFQN